MYVLLPRAIGSKKIKPWQTGSFSFGTTSPLFYAKEY